MSIVKKPIQVSFSALCGIANFAPVIRSGFSPIKIKEITDGAPTENNFTHTGSQVLKFTDRNPSDFHKATYIQLAGGYLGSFILSPVNQAANTVKWTFNVPDAAIDHLQEGETLVQKYKITINDGHGGKTSKIVTVCIVGTNDVPVIQCPEINHEMQLDRVDSLDPSCDVTGLVTEDQVNAPPNGLSDTGSFTFDDADLKDTHIISVLPSLGNIGTLTAVLTDTATGIGDGTITWTYNVDNALVQGLDDGETKTETFQVQIDDGHGGVVLQPVTVTIRGVNDAPEIVVDQGNPSGANDTVFESGLATGSTPSTDGEFAGGTFKLSDADGLDDLQSVTINGTTHSIADLILGTSTFPGLHGVLTVTAYDPLTGIATYTYELTSPTTDVPDVTETDVFTLTVSDGTTSSAPATITIDIVDDVPTAFANTNSVTEGGIVTGNVLTDGTADVFGADGPRRFRQAASSALHPAPTPPRRSRPASAAPYSGNFGKLTLNADGSYSL